MKLKNKYQEALGDVTYCMNVSQMHKKLTDEECNKLGEAIMQLQELVDKETSMQVIVTWCGQDDEDYYSYFCPICNNDLYGEEEKYCPNCGQKLDWRD